MAALSSISTGGEYALSCGPFCLAEMEMAESRHAARWREFCRDGRSRISRHGGCRAGEAGGVAPIPERRMEVRPVGQWAVEPEPKRNEPSEGEGSRAGRGRNTDGLV